MFEFFLEYETQINLTCATILIISYMMQHKIYFLLSTSVICYGIMLLNIFINILGKGL